MREDIDNIKTAAERAAQTIKDLLTLGRQGRRAKDDLDLNRLVKSCMLNGSWNAENGAFKLHIELAPDVLPLRGAESQLARAVSNLLRNAIEAVDGHGEVTVRTSRVDVATTSAGFETIPPGSYVVLTISDTGCGISTQISIASSSRSSPTSARARTPAPGSASRSCSASSRSTTGSSTSTAASAPARRSPSTCPPAQRPSRGPS